MAIHIEGSTCPICHKPLAPGADITLFPAFVINTNDPLYIFNDTAIHKQCVDRHPHGRDATWARNEFLSYTRPSFRRCALCDEIVKSPDNYIATGYLTCAKSSPLYRFNFLQFHRTCLSRWPELRQLKEAIASELQSKRWQGPSLQDFLHELNAIV